jgi:hypothetical protein
MMMKAVIGLVAVCVLLSACSDSATGPGQSDPTLTRVTVGIIIRDENDGNTAFNFHVGKTLQFFAEAHYPDVTQRTTEVTQRVTDVALWQTSDANVATISAAGVVLAVGPGHADILATYHDMTGRFGVLVIP